jgi:hypothetical protein
MIALLSAVGSLLSFRIRSRTSLELELVALRHQVTVLRRQRPSRPRLFSTDRLLWVWLYRIWPQVLNAMVLVKPATVVQWHRNGFRLYWRRRSRHLGRPRMAREIRELIRNMSLANPLWGAPRIHGELLKLGFDVSQATVGRYLPWRSKAPSPTWRSFLHNHRHDTAATDMFVSLLQGFSCSTRWSSSAMSGEKSSISMSPRTRHKAGWRAKSPRLSPGTPPSLSTARPRRFVWADLPRSCPGDGDRGGRHRAAIAMAECLRRAHHRLDPPRMSRSRHRLRRASLAPSAVDIL